MWRLSARFETFLLRPMSHGVAKHRLASALGSVPAVGERVNNCRAGSGLAFGGLLEQA
jgi:hypothetical protein